MGLKTIDMLPTMATTTAFIALTKFIFSTNREGILDMHFPRILDENVDIYLEPTKWIFLTIWIKEYA